MSAAPNGHKRKKATPRKILIFGESEYDTKAIAEFVLTLVDGRAVAVEARRNPPVLIRDANPKDVPSRASKLAAIVEAALVDSEVVAVVAHEDCDAVEPAHVATQQKIEAAFSRQRFPVIAATPAWEMEAWLMQWPLAFREHRPTWRSIEAYRNRNLGLISDVKEELIRALRPHGGGRGARDYRESDAPLIAAIVRRNGWTKAPEARSDSYTDFMRRTELALASV